MIASIIVGAVVILIVMYVLSKKSKDPTIMLNTTISEENTISDGSPPLKKQTAPEKSTKL